MDTKPFKSNYYTDDKTFDSIYPPEIQLLSNLHWTPLEIAKKAVEFLAPTPGKKVLDIGSGVGKFCLVGAYYFPNAEFYGVEQRGDLVKQALLAKEITDTKNVTFIHGNFTQLNLNDYDCFYFYNSFFENLIDDSHIDDGMDYSANLYIYYSNYLCKALANKPRGTRLVTFHGTEDEIPPSYKMVDYSMNKALKMWVKR